MKKTPPADLGLADLSPIELARIVPIEEASRLSSLSPDSIRRHYRDLLIQLGPNRQGMRVGVALTLKARQPA
jgi:hypothetical protein